MSKFKDVVMESKISIKLLFKMYTFFNGKREFSQNLLHGPFDCSDQP